jgi:hypothetical protein
MLLHIRPRLYSPFKNVALVDVVLHPWEILLVGGDQLRTGRPYRNKWYAVGCRKLGKKALDGILVEFPFRLEKFSYTVRWAIEAEFVVKHHVDCKVLDRDFDAASESMILWHAVSGELGNWCNRFPAGWHWEAPAVTEPMMEVVPKGVGQRRKSEDIIEGDWIMVRHESFSMPTIERERILQNRLRAERVPGPEMVFQIGG